MEQRVTPAWVSWKDGNILQVELGDRDSKVAVADRISVSTTNNKVTIKSESGSLIQGDSEYRENFFRLKNRPDGVSTDFTFMFNAVQAPVGIVANLVSQDKFAIRVVMSDKAIRDGTAIIGQFDASNIQIKVDQSGNNGVDIIPAIRAGSSIKAAGLDLQARNQENLIFSSATIQGGPVSIDAGYGSINVSNLTVNGNLTLACQGAIAQSGQMTVGGSLTLEGGGGGITLTHASNQFNDIVDLKGDASQPGPIKLYNQSELKIKGAATGDLSLASKSNITQTGPLQVGGNLAIAAVTGKVVLGNPDNQFLGTVDLAAVSAKATAIELFDKTDLEIYGTFAGGLKLGSGANLGLGRLSAKSADLSAVKAITQTGPLTVAETTSLKGNVIVLMDPANSFGGAVAFTGDDVRLKNAKPLALAASKAKVNVALECMGALTQTGPLTVGGKLQMTAAGTVDSITLTNQANDFGGAVAFAGGNVSLVNNKELTLAASNAKGDLSLKSPEYITQAGPITVGGKTTIVGKNITLAYAANSFNGPVSFTGAGVTLQNSIPLKLAASSATGNAKLTSTGAVTQAGSLKVGGETTLKGSDITLVDQANDFGGAVAFAGGNVSLVNNKKLTLAASNAKGDAVLTSMGPVTQTGALSVGGTIQVIAKGNDITLANSANSLTGLVSFAGNKVALANTKSLQLGKSDVQGDLSLQSQVAISQTGPLAVAGKTTLTGGAITLDKDNSLTGSVTFTGTGVTLYNTKLLQVGKGEAQGDLSLKSPEDITQAGPITVGGKTTLEGKNITLDVGANSFNGPVAFNGLDVSVVNGKPLTLAASAATGNVKLTSPGAVTQTGYLKAGGETTLKGSAITLANTDNAFRGAVHFEAESVYLHGQSGLLVGTGKTTQGDLKLSSPGKVQASDLDSAGGATLTGADILLQGKLSIGGDLFLQAKGVTPPSWFPRRIFFTSQGGDITFAQNSDCVVGGKADLAGKTIQLGPVHLAVHGDFNAAASADLTLGSMVVKQSLQATAKGAFTVAAGCTIRVDQGAKFRGSKINGPDGMVEIGNTLAIEATADILLGQVKVGGDLSAAAETIHLANPANQFTGSVSLAGKQATLRGPDLKLKDCALEQLALDASRSVSQLAGSSLMVGSRFAAIKSSGPGSDGLKIDLSSGLNTFGSAMEWYIPGAAELKIASAVSPFWPGKGKIDAESLTLYLPVTGAVGSTAQGSGEVIAKSLTLWGKQGASEVRRLAVAEAGGGKLNFLKVAPNGSDLSLVVLGDAGELLISHSDIPGSLRVETNLAVGFQGKETWDILRLGDFTLVGTGGKVTTLGSDSPLKDVALGTLALQGNATLVLETNPAAEKLVVGGGALPGPAILRLGVNGFDARKITLDAGSVLEINPAAATLGTAPRLDQAVPVTLRLGVLPEGGTFQPTQCTITDSLNLGSKATLVVGILPKHPEQASLVVSGALGINNCRLDLRIPELPAQNPDKIPLVAVGGASAGIFQDMKGAPLPEGAMIQVGVSTYQMRYQLDFGNGNHGVGLEKAQAVGFVGKLQALLGIAPSPGLDNLAAPTGSQAQRVALVNESLDSAAFRESWVAGLYTHLLGRTADQAGLAQQVGRLRQGASMTDILSGFLASDEYYRRVGATPSGFVGALYQTLLSRKAPFWESLPHVARLMTGATRLQVARSFLTSPEFAQRETATLFQSILGRDPAKTELAAWSAAMLAGRDPLRAVLSSVLASREAYQRLSATALPTANPSHGWLFGLQRI